MTDERKVRWSRGEPIPKDKRKPIYGALVLRVVVGLRRGIHIGSFITVYGSIQYRERGCKMQLQRVTCVKGVPYFLYIGKLLYKIKKKGQKGKPKKEAQKERMDSTDTRKELPFFSLPLRLSFSFSYVFLFYFFTLSTCTKTPLGYKRCGRYMDGYIETIGQSTAGSLPYYTTPEREKGWTFSRFYSSSISFLGSLFLVADTHWNLEEENRVFSPPLVHLLSFFYLGILSNGSIQYVSSCIAPFIVDKCAHTHNSPTLIFPLLQHNPFRKFIGPSSSSRQWNKKE